jgi:C-terminal processing protease CtpA/Prc
MSPIKSILLFLSFIFCINLIAQSEKLLSIKHMKKDFDEMLAVVEAHPDPFTHITEEEFMNKFNENKNSLNQPLSTLDYYKKVASLIALIRDGHSSVRMPSGWFEKKRKENGVFPLSFHLSTDDKLFVLKNYNDSEIPMGAEITKINDIPIKEFLASIDPYISYELKRFRNTRIDDNLEFYLYLAFGQSNNTRLEYTTGKIGSTTIQNMSFRDWKSKIKDTREERESAIAKGEPYKYENLKKGMGILKIYSFRTPDIDAYDRFLHKTFKSIKEDSIHSLILDVRGNYGGWPRIASKLFHYLTEMPFKTVAHRQLKVSKAYREYYYERYPQLRTSNYSFRGNIHSIDLDAVMRDKIGSFSNREMEYNELPKTRKFEFDGDLYLLTNRDSYSAASSFASTFQCYQMGTIIGDETGGTKIFRASAMYKKLTRTAIGVRMSTTKVLCSCFNQEFEGVAPTIEYVPSINELVADMDTHLMFTQRIIKKIQKKKLELQNEK